MEKKHHFLVIGCPQNDEWFEILEKVAVSLGTLQRTKEGDSLDRIYECDYDVIIIDAAYVQNVSLLISAIKAVKPGSRIFVATASRVWGPARDAYRAGAIDCILKSVDEAEALSELQKAVGKLNKSTS